MIVGPLAAVIVIVAIPALLVAMARDTVVSRRAEANTSVSPKPEPIWRPIEKAYRRIELERGVARAFVISGGVFWAVAAFAGLYSFRGSGIPAAFLGASVPLFAALVTLVVGWYWERLTAALLALASAGAVYYGVASQFEAGVWLLVGIFLIGPMLTAAALFWMARQEHVALQLKLVDKPEFALATARTSR